MKVHIWQRWYNDEATFGYYFDVMSNNNRLMCISTTIYKTKLSTRKIVKKLFPALEVIDHSKEWKNIK